MRNTLLFSFFSFISQFPIQTMEPPAEEKTWSWEIFHIIDQWTDPLSYFTDTRAPKVCDEVMRLGLPTDNPNFREYTGDTKCLDDIKSALKRQRALITSLEAECSKDGNSKVELLRDAYQRQKGYYSQNVLSLIESYLERSTHEARNAAYILDKQAGKTLEPAPTPEHLSSVDIIGETRAVTYQTIVNLVTGTPWYSWENGVNYLRKTLTDPQKYLIDEKAQNICLAMRHFHPRHKFHTEQWRFNNKLDFHTKLIHQALEREKRLTVALQYALENGKAWMVVNLNPENPENKFVMENIASCYSPLVRAAIKGFLTTAANKKEREVKEKQQREQEQKELIDKSQQIPALINSLRKKLSDAANKEKLQSLTESQRNIPLIAGNMLTAHPANRGAGLAEVRVSHKMLTEFSTVVEQLLASPTQSTQPALNNSTTSLPAIPSTSPTQPVVAPGQLAASTSPAASPSIQQTQLPAPAAAQPATPPASQSPSSSISSASEVAPLPPSKSTSPQASPPRTPNGSLVVEPLTTSTQEDEFNPRAKTAATPAPIPAAAKQPAEPKQQAEGKARKGKGK